MEKPKSSTKSWEELTFADNFLFCKILESEPELCRQKRELSLNDRAYKVFFNARDCDKLKTKEERDFFKFLKGEQAESWFAKTIEEKVERAKKNEKWRKIYMTCIRQF